LESGDTNQLRTILVDLTPVLPGGENGGAKVFVLELLRRLAEFAPQTQFVLLTQATQPGHLLCYPLGKESFPAVRLICRGD
jgi:hypothetical protein